MIRIKLTLKSKQIELFKVQFFIFVVRRLLAGDCLAPKILPKFKKKICLVFPLILWSVLGCPPKMLLSLGCLRFSLWIIELIIKVCDTSKK